MSTRSWRRSGMLARRFVNTSPLVFLVREDLLEMLRVGAGDIAVPEAVIEEIRGHGMVGEMSTIPTTQGTPP
jgi:hypothetical protein